MSNTDPALATDQALTDTQDAVIHDAGTAAAAFVKPTTPSVVVRPLTFDEVLTESHLPEKSARICLRADLQADLDALLDELATLVTVDGQLVVDPESSLADEHTHHAQDLDRQITDIRATMADSMRAIRFRGLDSDALAVHNKKHEPKDPQGDRKEYNYRLVAACAIEPDLSYEQVVQMAGKLGNRAMLELVNAALGVCYGGGIDVPKSRPLSPPLRAQ